MQSELTEEKIREIQRATVDLAIAVRKRFARLNDRLAHQKSTREDYERRKRAERSHAQSKAQKQAKKRQRNK